MIEIWYTDHKNGNRRRLRAIDLGANLVYGVAWSPNGQILASGHDDGTVRFWNPNSGVNWAILRRHTDTVRQVAFSPNGQMLASVGDGSPQVVLWNVNTRAVVRTISIGARKYCGDVAWSPDGQILAVGSTFPSTIHLYDPNTGTRKYRLSHDTRTSGWVAGFDIAFRPNGRYLASGGQDNTLKIWKRITVNPLDVNKDGQVSISDLIEVAKNYGKTGTNKRRCQQRQARGYKRPHRRCQSGKSKFRRTYPWRAAI